jgi:hypothetical protein
LWSVVVAGPHIDADAIGTLRCTVISVALRALVIVPEPRLTFASSGTAGLCTRHHYSLIRKETPCDYRSRSAC